MNRLQEKEREILATFLEVCQSLGLKPFLVCGSALGAVKYQGFIPWDDDIDVAMYREDYEIFCEQAPALLPDHLFLQTYKTDPAFPAIYGKLRDSRTTFIEHSVSKLDIHQGIGIDIFPLDGYPESSYQQKLLEVKKKIYARLLSSVFYRQSWWKELIMKVLRLMGTVRFSAKIAERYSTMIQKYSPMDSSVLTNHGNWQGKLDYTEKEVFGEGYWAEFEGLKVVIPRDFDRYLRKKYGNYWEDPPKDAQRSHHMLAIVDPDTPYTHYRGDQKA